MSSSSRLHCTLVVAFGKTVASSLTRCGKMPRNVCFYLFAGSESRLIHSALELEGEREARRSKARQRAMRRLEIQLGAISKQIENWSVEVKNSSRLQSPLMISMSWNFGFNLLNKHMLMRAKKIVLEELRWRHQDTEFKFSHTRSLIIIIIIIPAFMICSNNWQ